MHVNEMNVFTWSMDAASGKEVAEGEIGGNIITTYVNRAQPLLNYRSHDAGSPALGLQQRPHLDQARRRGAGAHRFHR